MAGEAVWLVGGLDPSGGAGVLRDVATVRALAPSRPVHVVVTALTQQGDGQPAAARVTEANALLEQLERAPTPAAIKLGLVPAALASLLVKHLPDAPRVVDPVLSASAGGAMGAEPAALRPLLRDALVTPNRSEARALLAGQAPDAWLEDVGALALLRKSVASTEHSIVDVLHTPQGERRLERPRVAGPDPRGTGCALATAIACGLARGASMVGAVSAAVAWLDEARTGARQVGPQVLLP